MIAELQVRSNPEYEYFQTGCTGIQLLDVQKKSLSKPINMGSSFEDLDAMSLKVKTVRNLDKRFSRYFVFKLQFKKIKGKKLPSHLLYSFLSHPHFNFGCDTWRTCKHPQVTKRGEGDI